jgi:predicted transcriptional regulator YdeE
MDVLVITLPDRWVMGVQARIQPMGADYGALWHDGFDPHAAEIEPLAVEEGYYGVYYPTGEPGWVDFVAGVVVPEGAPAPAGCVVRLLPGGAYARVDVTMAAIASTWGAIYGEWLPGSGYVEDEERPALEHYPPAEMSPQAPVSIFVAVRPVA